MKNIFKLLVPAIFLSLVFVACNNDDNDTPASVTLPATSAVPIGDTITLRANVLLEDTTVTWLSSNTDVAIVNDTGLVTGISYGTTMITATTRAGGYIATSALTVTMLNRCNTNTPGWGEDLGTVTRGTQTWTIEGNGITQIWSDAVTATNCQKTTFNGGDLNAPNFSADCRSNPGFPGDLFSWCAVVRFADQLCPYPWRVPTVQDFIDLDIAMGGNGRSRSDTINGFSIGEQVRLRYSERWGGRFGGLSNSAGSLWHQGSWGYYWSSTEANANSARSLAFARFATESGSIWPQTSDAKFNGFALRCVR